MGPGGAVKYSQSGTYAYTDPETGKVYQLPKLTQTTTLSPEQQAEIQRFLDEQVRIRQELRAVRRNLDADIERLGTWLKAINIVLMPVLLTLAALGVVLMRRNRKARR